MNTNDDLNTRPDGETMLFADKQAQAKRWLQDFLQSGPKPTPEVFSAGADAGFSDRVLLFDVCGQIGGKKFRDKGEVFWEIVN